MGGQEIAKRPDKIHIFVIDDNALINAVVSHFPRFEIMGFQIVLAKHFQTCPGGSVFPVLCFGGLYKFAVWLYSNCNVGGVGVGGLISVHNVKNFNLARMAKIRKITHIDPRRCYNVMNNKDKLLITWLVLLDGGRCTPVS